MQTAIKNLDIFIDGDDKNTPIIFVHGFPYDNSMWDEQVKALSNEYYCVRYDIRGLGTSPAGDGQFTIEMFVDDLENIINELKLDRPILCGLSMGGYISLRAIERMQEKFNALILCDTKSAADDNEGKVKRAAAIKQINSGDFDSFVESFVLNCFGEKFVRENNTEYRRVVDRSRKSNPLGVKGCLLAMAGRTDTTGYLPKIKLPTLVICGSEDKLTPPAVMELMTNQIQNSEFIIVNGAGHMTPIENSQMVNEIIKNFLVKNKM
ncbi:MAG: alpha/beta fold hydrolase [Ignavibacteriaceae bacterium]|jgi:3-oxoadipate enol-lactonase|nr:alpha/beta fold hydrolase [Chlorobium sp.]MCW8823022.1 alpha/beta fold hydrolase [Ignavibacteriaceae bacterium]MCW8961770.1 alpha/beta fold hydrolase [Ignavibacteriaceae bacterium]MCW9095834.1 alpha/beta fold hydrolase [Ignavibacteriaceae bacterium]